MSDDLVFDKNILMAGNRVRLVIEGVITRSQNITNSEQVWFGDLACENNTRVSLRHVTEVTKIEPKEIFIPGDLVREIYTPHERFALGSGGYINLRNGVWNNSRHQFTSDNYELVFRP